MRFVETLKSRKKEIREWEELRKVLKEHDVELAYIFGSHASGEITDFSDLDVGVLFKSKAKRNMESLRLDLTELLGEEAIDIIDLEKAPPRLRYNVVKEGEIILEDDRKAGFEARTMQEYFDFRPLEEMYFEGMKKRIESGKFGK